VVQALMGNGVKPYFALLVDKPVKNHFNLFIDKLLINLLGHLFLLYENVAS
jgi:hypothetical protein